MAGKEFMATVSMRNKPWTGCEKPVFETAKYPRCFATTSEPGILRTRRITRSRGRRRGWGIRRGTRRRVRLAGGNRRLGHPGAGALYRGRSDHGSAGGSRGTVGGLIGALAGFETAAF
jgi:hypothetical protein